jgi:PAS domain S-box-containing protein
MHTFAQFISLPSLDSAIDFFPLTVAPETLLSDVIALMKKHQPQARCVLIVENLQIVGWFTEHDALHLLFCDVNLQTAKVSEVMRTSVPTLKYSEIPSLVFILSFLRQYNLFCVPLIDEHSQLVGLCTYETICQVIEKQTEDILSNSSHCCTCGSSEDITDQKRTTETLCESEEQFRKLANELPILIWMSDANGLNTFLNQQSVEFTGRSLEELLDTGWVEGIHPEDKQHCFDTYLWAFKNYQHFHYVCRYLRADGEYRSLMNIGVPRFASDDSFVGYIGCCIDITERVEAEAALQQAQADLETRVEERTRAVKEMNRQLIFEMTDRLYAEEQLRQSQQMLQLIMDNIPQGIFWKNTASVYLGCNRIFAKMFGLESAENVVGKTDYDLVINEEEADFYCESDLKVMETDTPEYHIIFSRILSDGKQVWFLASKIPLHDHEGNVMGVLGTFEDITERKQAEESLQLSIGGNHWLFSRGSHWEKLQFSARL